MISLSIARTILSSNRPMLAAQEYSTDVSCSFAISLQSIYLHRYTNSRRRLLNRNRNSSKQHERKSSNLWVSIKLFSKHVWPDTFHSEEWHKITVNWWISLDLETCSKQKHNVDWKSGRKEKLTGNLKSSARDKSLKSVRTKLHFIYGDCEA